MVYKSKYSWRNGYKPKVSAEIVGNALEKLKDETEDGTVNAEMLLDYSRPEDSDTHDLFEWNDGIAAEKWRVYQSGRIINQLEIEIIEVPKEAENVEVILTPIESLKKPIRTYAFVNIEGKGPAKRGVYMDTKTAFRDELIRKRILHNAYNDLKSFERRYGNLKELESVFVAIHDFGESINDSKTEN